jgi:DNA-binding NarL/FixJ family response regulator
MPESAIGKPLTQREQQVLEQVLRGSTSKEIARALHLSHRTVGVHRSKLLRKLHARNSIELVRKALSLDQEA